MLISALLEAIGDCNDPRTWSSFEVRAWEDSGVFFPRPIRQEVIEPDMFALSELTSAQSRVAVGSPADALLRSCEPGSPVRHRLNLSEQIGDMGFAEAPDFLTLAGAPVFVEPPSGRFGDHDSDALRLVACCSAESRVAAWVADLNSSQIRMVGRKQMLAQMEGSELLRSFAAAASSAFSAGRAG